MIHFPVYEPRGLQAELLVDPTFQPFKNVTIDRKLLHRLTERPQASPLSERDSKSIVATERSHRPLVRRAQDLKYIRNFCRFAYPFAVR